MSKQAYFFIDDVIWTMRDIARQRPESLFDNPFMKMLKKAHDDNGMTVQLNLFYRTDFSYGDDEFTLADMPDSYKEEFSENSDWLKLSMHSKQEKPEYPFVNMDYEGVKANFERVAKEIRRFAGEKSLSYAVIPHWHPMSLEGCRALFDCGVKFLSCSVGEAKEYEEAREYITGADSMRILYNRKPETKVYLRRKRDDDYVGAICGHNHISTEKRAEMAGKNISFEDEKTGLRFRSYSNGPCLNRYKKDEFIPDLEKVLGCEYVGYATHEQYFYADYPRYQPYYADSVYTASKILKDNGYTYITWEELK